MDCTEERIVAGRTVRRTELPCVYIEVGTQTDRQTDKRNIIHVLMIYATAS
jgi:hypothetical protein